MRLDDGERDELRASARKLLNNESSSAHVRAMLDDVRGSDPALWSKMAELGWLAIHVPEEHGGMGASYADVIAIVHELGRQVAPSPFLASALLGAEALLAGSNSTLRDHWLPDVVGGQRVVTVACANSNGSYEPSQLSVGWHADGGIHLDGVARFVPDAHIADAIIVSAADLAGDVTFALVDPASAGVRVTVEPTMDETRRLCRVEIDDLAVPDSSLLGEPGSLAGLQRRVASLGAIAVMADSVGAAEHMLEVSTQYAKERQQFGRAIGSFQAVKHHLANMLIAVEGSRAAVAHAADVLDDPSDDRDMAASVAKSFAGPACAHACQVAVQVHGGIGFTWEHDAHLHLKRAKLNEALFGSTSWHRRRLGGGLLEIAQTR